MYKGRNDVKAQEHVFFFFDCEESYLKPDEETEA